MYGRILIASMTTGAIVGGISGAFTSKMVCLHLGKQHHEIFKDFYLKHHSIQSSGPQCLKDEEQPHPSTENIEVRKFQKEAD